METFDYISPFYADHHTLLGIVREIDSLLSAQSLNVRAIPLACEIGTVQWLDGRKSGESLSKILYSDGRLTFPRAGKISTSADKKSHK